MFGGAGGQMGTGIAEILDIPRIIIPRFSSILSAYGMSLADVVVEAQEPAAFLLDDTPVSQVRQHLERLEQQGRAKLQRQGFATQSVQAERYLHCRYQGSTTQLMIQQPKGEDFALAFKKEHQEQFGFTLVDRAVICDDVRVRCIGMSGGSTSSSPYQAMKQARLRPADLRNVTTKMVYYEKKGYVSTHIIALKDLDDGAQVPGPAIVFDETQTILIEPGWIGTALPEHVVIDLNHERPPKGELDLEHVDPVELSVMGHRFMSIAEQMGNVLRQTAISVNIKERLDFSCALVGERSILGSPTS